MAAIYILWLRQLKRYSRSRARIITSLMQPILFMIALGSGFSPIFAQAGHGNYREFLAPGVIAMSVLFTGVFSGIEILWDRQFGFLKETLVAPISRLKIVFGRTLGSATVALIQGILMLIICVLFGVKVNNLLALPMAFIFLFMLALFFTSIGSAIASVLEDMQGFQLITNILVMPMFFFSNALFPVDDLKGPFHTLIQLNPLSYGVDGVRGAMSGIYAHHITTDFAVLAAITAVVMAVASYLFSRIQV
jgi:ABC-2 type transport system permease protein